MSMEISKNKKTALLFGVDRQVGKYCLNFLLASPAYDKVLVFNKKAIKVEHANLQQHQIDLDELHKYMDLIKGDDLYCCLGSSMRKEEEKDSFNMSDSHVYQIAEIAVKNKISQFLFLSGVGADKDALLFQNQVKGALEEELKLMPFWAVYIFQPSILIGERNENRWGESIAQRLSRGFDRLTGGLLKKYKPVEADVVAKAMVTAAQRLKKGIHVYPSQMLQDMAEQEELKIQSRNKKQGE